MKHKGQIKAEAEIFLVLTVNVVIVTKDFDNKRANRDSNGSPCSIKNTFNNFELILFVKLFC